MPAGEGDAVNEGEAARRLRQTDNGDCSTEQWALDAVKEIEEELGLGPRVVQLVSCVQGNSNPEQATCDDPAYFLSVRAVLDPSMNAEESRCVCARLRCGAALQCRVSCACVQ